MPGGFGLCARAAPRLRSIVVHAIASAMIVFIVASLFDIGCTRAGRTKKVTHVSVVRPFGVESHETLRLHHRSQPAPRAHLPRREGHHAGYRTGRSAQRRAV